MGLFASERIVANEKKNCNPFEKFYGFLHGIWTHVADSTEIVLDSKNNLASNRDNCERCTKESSESCELVLLRIILQTVIIQTEIMKRALSCVLWNAVICE